MANQLTEGEQVNAQGGTKPNSLGMRARVTAEDKSSSRFAFSVA
jgi:hypothetical protein